MKKIIALLILALLLCGCVRQPDPTTVPTESATVPTTSEPAEETLEPFVQENVELEAVNKLSFCKTSESPAVAVLDERTAAFLTEEYVNKDFSKRYTRIRVLDLHMDAVRREVLLEGEYTVMEHCTSGGWLVLSIQEEDLVLVLDADLQEVLRFQTEALNGVLSPDLGSYYYVWGSRLYCQNTESGVSALYEASYDLLLDEIWGYDPEENILLDQIKGASVALSCKQHELGGAVERVIAERDQLRFKNEQLGLRVFEMMAAQEAEKAVRMVVCDVLPASAVRKAAGKLGAGAKLALVLVPREDGYSFAMSSETEDVRPATKALCQQFGGKGGGPKDMTQGVLTGGTEAEIRKALDDVQ